MDLRRRVLSNVKRMGEQPGYIAKDLVRVLESEYSYLENSEPNSILEVVAYVFANTVACLSRVSPIAEDIMSDDKKKVQEANIKDIYNIATDIVMKVAIEQVTIPLEMLAVSDKELNETVQDYLRINDFMVKAIDYTKHEILRESLKYNAKLDEYTKAFESGNYVKALYTLTMLTLEIAKDDEIDIVRKNSTEVSKSVSLYEKYLQLPSSIKNSGDMKLILETLETMK